MPITITMPRLSDTMTEGTLIKWRVKVGDAVKSGDVLADIETDKATMELQSYDDGTVAALAVGEGQTAAVGKTILVLTEGSETVEAAAKAAGEGAGVDSIGEVAGGAATVAGEPQTVAVELGAAAESGVTAGGRLRISPLARKIAEQLHVDDDALRSIRGTGPDGRIIKRDILAAAGQGVQPPTAPGVPTSAPLSPPGEGIGVHADR